MKHRYVLALLAALCVLLMHAAMLEAKDAVCRLESPSSSYVFKKQYPKRGCALVLKVSCAKPGTVLDTVGINAAPAGSFALVIGSDGKVSFQIYDPSRQSAVRLANGWHVLTSESALKPLVDNQVRVEVDAGAVRLFVNGTLERSVDAALSLSGEPIYVGDFPGDESWSPRYDVHRGMVGTVTLRYIGALAGAPPLTERAAPTDDGAFAPETVTKSVGPAGGAIELSDGTAVELPAGAVSGDTAVTVSRVDPAGHFSNTDDRVRSVIECTAPVSRFSAPVKIRFPLPADVTGEGARRIRAGYIDEQGVMKVELPCSFEEENGRKALVLQTDHFSNFFMDRVRNALSSPPSSRTIPNVPYYSQGSSPYCWAACTQMICEAVTAVDTPGEIWDIIGKMKVPPGGLSSIGGAFSGTWSGIIKRRTKYAPDMQYWQASMTRLRSYIYDQVGLYGLPVLYSSASLEHAVVIVGYDTVPAEPVFIIHDPGATGSANVAYRRVTASKLFIANGDTLTNAVVTVVVPLDVSTRPAVRVTLANLDFALRTGKGVYTWAWDHTRDAGYSYKTDARTESDTGVDTIPGTILSVRGKSFIEVSNATSTEQALSCDYSIASGRKSFVVKHNYVVVPAYGLAAVAIDPVDFNRCRTQEGDLGPAYTFHVSLLKGGDYIDSASVDFSEPRVKIRRPLGTAEKGVKGYDYKFSVETSGVPAKAEYTWDFGDQSGTTQGEKVTHRYKDAGSFTVSVSAKWHGAEVSDKTVMVIAPDTPEAAKAEVTIYVFRYFKNKFGKSKKACNEFSVKIFKNNVYVDGGTSIARNGDFTITLPVGTGYSYEVNYNYTDPHRDSGMRSGNFTIVKDRMNFVEVETPPFEAFDR